MRLWIRVAWRLLEWPLNVVIAVAPLALCIAVSWGHYDKNGNPLDFRGGVGYLGGVVFGALGLYALICLFDGGDRFTQQVAEWWRDLVSQERKKLEVERGDPTADTYLRPVEND